MEGVVRTDDLGGPQALPPDGVEDKFAARLVGQSSERLRVDHHASLSGGGLVKIGPGADSKRTLVRYLRGSHMKRLTLLLVTATAALALAAGCGGDDEPEPAAGNDAVISEARDESATRNAARAYLLAHGAREATTDDPGGYWSAGDVYLPAGGPSCSVAEIFTGSTADLAESSVRDASGTVAVKMTSTAEDNVACLEAGAAAIEGFTP